MPISAVSSWYDWERLDAGLVAAVSSMDDLHAKVNGRPPAACAATRASLQTEASAASLT